METIELLTILALGEDSEHQFKKDVTNADSLCADMVAFSNGSGGQIFIGVTDEGNISGLATDDVRRLNQLISSQQVQPPINPITENVATDHGIVLVISVTAGINKPYQDKNGVFWVKSGSDKRKATSREEIQRLFQASGLVHGDEYPANGLTIADLDMDYFRGYFQQRYSESLDEQQLPLEQIIENMNLGRDGVLNVTGALLFARQPSLRLHMFIVKAVCFPGRSIATDVYLDNRDITGKIADIFQQTISFINANINHVQGDQTVNSVGKPEIPRIALEEIVANALVHRDYFISAPIRVFIFEDRVEIISPGHLPNNLTIDNIKAGNSNARNPILASFANQILPYREYGSGIIRALEAFLSLEFVDDKDGNLFKAIFKRK